MNSPKLHHYVPQFHLRRFANEFGKVWVWDRDQDRTFQAGTTGVAAEKQFYRLDQYEVLGHDPLTMEKQLSALESEAAFITDQWIGWLRTSDLEEKIEIPKTNREIISLYLATQHLRTADTRQILAALAEKDYGQIPSQIEQRRLHTELMWDEKIVKSFTDRFEKSIWVFARNVSNLPLITSDNPITFRSKNNRQWLRLGFFQLGAYAGFPISPDLIMYCYPNEEPWTSINRLSDCLSPVELDQEMVESENSGQVFMASRFVVSSQNRFDAERAFAPSIGTDMYADPVGEREEGE